MDARSCQGRLLTGMDWLIDGAEHDPLALGQLIRSSHRSSSAEGIHRILPVPWLQIR